MRRSPSVLTPPLEPLAQPLLRALASFTLVGALVVVLASTASGCGDDSGPTEEPCEPDCDGKACGDDGCGGTCGDCSGGTCTPAGVCDVCEPDCAGRECGDDGCGGSCGDCPNDVSCTDDGACLFCEPNCNTKECGSDGCGGLCGVCDIGQQCSAQGQCEACTPQCDGKECGDDGCGGVCGECEGDNAVCAFGLCECQPSCAAKVCGSDGCFGSCGTCEGAQICDADQSACRCENPQKVGVDCDACVEPKFTGPNCLDCTDPDSTAPDCADVPVPVANPTAYAFVANVGEEGFLTVFVGQHVVHGLAPFTYLGCELVDAHPSFSLGETPAADTEVLAVDAEGYAPLTIDVLYGAADEGPVTGTLAIQTSHGDLEVALSGYAPNGKVEVSYSSAADKLDFTGEAASVTRAARIQALGPAPSTVLTAPTVEPEGLLEPITVAYVLEDASTGSESLVTEWPLPLSVGDSLRLDVTYVPDAFDTAPDEGTITVELQMPDETIVLDIVAP